MNVSKTKKKNRSFSAKRIKGLRVRSSSDRKPQIVSSRSKERKDDSNTPKDRSNYSSVRKRTKSISTLIRCMIIN